MLSCFSKAIMFLTSYVPLYVIFLINLLFDINFNLNNLTTIGKIVFTIIILLLILPSITLILIFKLKKKTSTHAQINKVMNSNEEVLNYVLAYIIPFISTELLKINNLITFLIFFFIIGSIYVKNSLIHINPTLYFAGYNIYLINDNQTLISKKSYEELRELLYTEIKVSILGHNIYLDISNHKK